MADAKSYHVQINGEGYILLDESYFIQAQKPFSPRFATGDNSFGDLSFWQFLTQETWKGGQGQDIFTNIEKYKESSGWDVRDGRPKLGFGPADLPVDNAIPAPSLTSAVLQLYDDCESGVPANLWQGIVNLTYPVVTGGHAWSDNIFDASAPPSGFPVGFVGSWSKKSDIAISGQWQFVAWIDESAGDTGGWGMFAVGADNVVLNSGYRVEWSGLNGTTLKFYRAQRNGSAPDFLLGTATIPNMNLDAGAGGAKVTIRIERDSNGDFRIYANAVLEISVNDTTMVMGGRIAMNTRGGGAVGAPPPYLSFIDDVQIPASPTQGHVGLHGKSVFYDNEIWFCHTTADAAFTLTEVKTGSIASNIPTIRHINARDILVVERDGDIGGKSVFLVAVHGTQYRVLKGVTTVATAATLVTASVVAKVNENTLIFGGTIGDLSGVVGFNRKTFSAASWGEATNKLLTADGTVQGTVANSFATDINGTLYFACNDMFANLGNVPSRIFQFTAADAIKSAWAISKINVIPNVLVRGLYDLGGQVYMFGASIEGDTAFNTVVRFPGEVVYKSENPVTIDPVTDAVRFNFGIQGVFKHFNSVLMMSDNELGSWSPLLEMQSDETFKEIASFNADYFANAEPDPRTVFEYSGHFYLIKPVGGTIDRTSATRGSFPANFPDLRLALSEMGGNTPLIDKFPYTVTIELSTPLPATESMQLEVNGTTIGSIADTDGTEVEIPITVDLTARSFNLFLVALRTLTWQGYVKRVTLRYVPTQFKKRQWGFSIRAENSIRLVSGQRESRTADEIFQDLQAAWQSNVPILFTDVDGRQYTVIITDFKGRQPVQASERGRREYIVPMELLEV